MPLSLLGVFGRELIQLAPALWYADELCLTPSEGTQSHIHFAFQAESGEQVQWFYEAAIAAGGRDHGGPGERTYHPGYYAAFVFDPDGNNVEAVYHGPAARSAPSVVITAPG